MSRVVRILLADAWRRSRSGPWPAPRRPGSGPRSRSGTRRTSARSSTRARPASGTPRRTARSSSDGGAFRTALGPGRRVFNDVAFQPAARVGIAVGTATTCGAPPTAATPGWRVAPEQRDDCFGDRMRGCDGLPVTATHVRLAAGVASWITSDRRRSRKSTRDRRRTRTSGQQKPSDDDGRGLLRRSRASSRRVLHQRDPTAASSSSQSSARYETTTGSPRCQRARPAAGQRLPPKTRRDRADPANPLRAWAVDRRTGLHLPTYDLTTDGWGAEGSWRPGQPGAAP